MLYLTMTSEAMRIVFSGQIPHLLWRIVKYLDYGTGRTTCLARTGGGKRCKSACVCDSDGHPTHLFCGKHLGMWYEQTLGPNVEVWIPRRGKPDKVMVTKEREFDFGMFLYHAVKWETRHKEWELERGLEEGWRLYKETCSMLCTKQQRWALPELTEEEIVSDDDMPSMD